MSLLDPGLDLTLRPMRYPQFYELYRTALRNTWMVEEVDFSLDLKDLARMGPGERHLIHRIVAFFATGDNIVAHNLVLSLYQHLNSPEARMYLGRQMFEEMLHVQFYLTLLDTYVPDMDERHEAFRAVEAIPSIRQKAEFCFQWTDALPARTESAWERQRFLRNLIAYGGAVEGLFFFAAFAYVYFLRSRGLLTGLATGTNWVFRDESMHLAFVAEAVRTIREEEPHLFTEELTHQVHQMMREAVACETQFAVDVLSGDVLGLRVPDMSRYLAYVADQRLKLLGFPPIYHASNPFDFMRLQDVEELTNFFERPVTAYQRGIVGRGDDVALEEEF